MEINTAVISITGAVRMVWPYVSCSISQSLQVLMGNGYECFKVFCSSLSKLLLMFSFMLIIYTQHWGFLCIFCSWLGIQFLLLPMGVMCSDWNFKIYLQTLSGSTHTFAHATSSSSHCVLEPWSLNLSTNVQFICDISKLWLRFPWGKISMYPSSSAWSRLSCDDTYLLKFVSILFL